MPIQIRRSCFSKTAYSQVGAIIHGVSERFLVRVVCNAKRIFDGHLVWITYTDLTSKYISRLKKMPGRHRSPSIALNKYTLCCMSIDVMMQGKLTWLPGGPHRYPSGGASFMAPLKISDRSCTCTDIRTRWCIWSHLFNQACMQMASHAQACL